MKLWNFTHNVIGIHVYELLAILILILMVVFGLIHRNRQKHREKDYEKQLEEIEKQQELAGTTGEASADEEHIEKKEDDEE